MKFAATALISFASAYTVAEKIFELESTGNEMYVIEAWGNSDREYSKVVVFLHGGYDSGEEMYLALAEGWFGEGSDIEDIKFIFPTTTREDNLWYAYYTESDAEDVEAGCEFSLLELCSYSEDDMLTSGQELKEVIYHEIDDNGIAPENVFLGGFSQGGRMTWHVAFAQLDEAIGGYFPMTAFPQWPILPEEANPDNVVYYGPDMNWFVFNGGGDTVYDEVLGQETYQGVFADLAITDTIRYEVIVDGLGHWIDSRWFDVMMAFVNTGEVTSIEDFEQKEWDDEWYEEDYYHDDWYDYSEWYDEDYSSDDGPLPGGFSINIPFLPENDADSDDTLTWKFVIYVILGGFFAYYVLL